MDIIDAELSYHTLSLTKRLNILQICDETISEPHFESEKATDIVVEMVGAYIIHQLHEKKFTTSLEHLLTRCLSHGNLKSNIIEKLRGLIMQSKNEWRNNISRLSAVNVLCHIVSYESHTNKSSLVKLLGEIIETTLSPDAITTSTDSTLYQHHIKYALIKDLSLFEEFNMLWTQHEYLLPLALLWKYASTSSDSTIKNQANTLKLKVLEVYNKKILQAKVTPSTHVLNMMNVFISSLSQQDLCPLLNNTTTVTAESIATETFDMLALKTLKKAPEGSAKTISTLLSQLSSHIDVSQFVLQGGSTATLKMMKSTTTINRYYGLKLYENLIIRAKQCDAYMAMIRVLLDVIQGKGGTISSAAQRIYIYLGFMSGSKYLKIHVEDSDSRLKLVEEIVTAMSTALQKETDESVKWTMTQCLAMWLIHSDKLPPTFLEAVKTAVSKNSSTAYSYLSVCTYITRYYMHTANIDQLNVFESLATPLVTIVKDSTKYPLAIQPLAMLSMEILLRLSTVSSSVYSLLSTQKVFAMITASTSSIHVLQYLNSNLLQGFKVSTTSGTSTTTNTSEVYQLSLQHTQKLESSRLSSVFDDVVSHLGDENEIESILHTYYGIQKQSIFMSQSITSTLSLCAKQYPLAYTSINYDQCKYGNPGVINTFLSLLLHPSVIVHYHTCNDLKQLFTALNATTTAQDREKIHHNSQLLSLHLYRNFQAILTTYSETHEQNKNKQLTLTKSAAGTSDDMDTNVTKGIKSLTPSGSILLNIMQSINTYLYQSMIETDEDNAVNTTTTTTASISMIVDPSISGQIFGQSLCILGHPLLHISPMSKRVMYLMEDLVINMSLSKEAYTDIATQITSCLHTHLSMNRVAAHNALILLLLYTEEHGAKIFQSSILPTLVQGLITCDISQLTTDDLFKYHHSEQAIAAIIEKSEVKEDEIKITNADRKKDSNRGARRGMFGADVVEDEEWAERIKKEKMKKLALERSGGVSDVASAARQEVNAVIEKVKNIISQATHTLDCLTYLFQAYTKLNHAVSQHIISQYYNPIITILLGETLDLILSRLPSDLLHQPAYLCIQAIAKMIESDLSVLSSDIAASLRYVALYRQAITASTNTNKDKGKGKDSTPAGIGSIESAVLTNQLYIGPLSRCIKGLSGSHRFIHYRKYRHQLSAETLSHGEGLQQCISNVSVMILFPVIRSVLNQTNIPIGCESSFFILDSVWPPGTLKKADDSITEDTDITQSTGSILRQYLIKPVMETILSSIHSHPRVDPRPDDVLRRVINQLNDGMTLSETLPLLNDCGLLNDDPHVRVACMKAIHSYMKQCPKTVILNMMNPLLESRLWLCQFDTDPPCADEGVALWKVWTELCGHSLSSEYYTAIVALFSHNYKSIREASSHALSKAIAIHIDTLSTTLDNIKTLFNLNKPAPATQSVKESATAKLTPSLNTTTVDLPRASTTTAKKPQTINTGLMGIGDIGKPVAKKPAPAGSISAISALSKPTPIATKSSTKSSISSATVAAVSTPVIARAPVAPQQPTAQSITKDMTRESIAQFLAFLGKDKVLELTANSHEIVGQLIEFILNEGTTDGTSQVREAMVLAGRSLIDHYCLETELCTAIITSIRSIMNQKMKTSTPEEAEAYDNKHEAGVVLLGALGKHLRKDDPAVVEITDSLVTALKTPSESVQRAVADCLGPLIQVMKGSDYANSILEKLMIQTLEGDTYGERRGGAYGVSACVKGLGIPSLKQFDIVNRLKEACSEGTVNARQGSLFALECLADRLGLLFEPHVITIVPILLKSFSHPSDYVREAAQGAAKIIMSRLSAHGVKQMLTPVLNSLPTETQWKSRQEAIRLLGMMANCAPKQLSTCLPQIVPKLVEAGSDPHPKVKESAKSAMSDIANVIRSPELSKLSPVLLSALGDPSNKTKDALEALLECEFTHSIDAPSLALLAPILARALKDRVADLKRKGSAIAGNMMSMVSDPKNIVPYMGTLLPGLKACLVDPIPDVRATSAKALGALVGGVGEEQEEIRDIVPWLFVTLASETSPVERSGAAQGLAEICQALGELKLKQVLYDALPLKSHPNPAPREGLLWLLSFLPSAMIDSFGPFIPDTLPVILDGLSSENEGVREVALRAGHVLVGVMGKEFTMEILPPLVQGMFADDHRIRLNSLTLLGELLCMVADTKTVGLQENADNDEDDIAAAAGPSRIIAIIRHHVGEKRANSLFASIYIARSDLVNSVRHAALQVWKSVITNTPRTLMEIMGDIVQQIIEKLSSEYEELRLVAGRALGEVVKKLGDRVLPYVMPHLQKGLSSEDVSTRQGVCLGLSEILTAATRKQIEDYLSLLVLALKQALCDDNENVRNYAAKAFLTLFKSVGFKAIEEVVPPLLENLQEGVLDSELSLLAIRELVQVRPRDMLEFLLPQLITHPMQTSSAHVLGTIADVCSGQLMYHFNFLVPMYVSELDACEESIKKLTAKVESMNKDSTIQQLEGGEEKTRLPTDTENDKEEEDEEGEVEYEDIDDNDDDDDDDGEDEDYVFELEVEQERFEAIQNSASILFSVIEDNGVGFLLSELGAQIEHESNLVARRWGCWILEQFLSRTKADYSEYLQIILRYLLSRIADLDKNVLSSMIGAFTALVNGAPLDLLITNIDFMRNCMSSTVSDARFRPGFKEFISTTGDFLLPIFTLPKSLDPFITLFLHGLLNGTVSVREAAAEGLSEVITATDSTGLKAYFIKITGPLIRVLGDRVPSDVKSAILRTISILLEKGGNSLKAFAPQLQTTFVKSLSDSSKTVLQRAVKALGQVMTLSARVDPLINELCTLCASTSTPQSADDGTSFAGSAIKSSILAALANTLQKCGDKATSASYDKIKSTVMNCITDEDESVRINASKCLTGMAVYFEESQVTDLLLDLVIIPTSTTGTGANDAGKILALAGVMQAAGQRGNDMREEVYENIKKGFSDERIPVRVASCSAVEILLDTPSYVGIDARKAEYKSTALVSLHAFADSLAQAAGDGQSSEVRKYAIHAIKEAAKKYPTGTQKQIQKFTPPLMTALKDINIRVKYIAERALRHLYDGGNSTVVSLFESTASSVGNRDLVKTVKDYCKTTLSRMPVDSDDEADKF